VGLTRHAGKDKESLILRKREREQKRERERERKWERKYGKYVPRILSGGDVEAVAKELEAVERLLRAWGWETVTIERFTGDRYVGPGWFVTIDGRFECGGYGGTLPDAFRAFAGRELNGGTGWFYATSGVLGGADGTAPRAKRPVLRAGRVKNPGAPIVVSVGASSPSESKKRRGRVRQ
jgi:hypothetical protein